MLECNLELSVEMFLFTNVNKIMNTDRYTHHGLEDGVNQWTCTSCHMTYGAFYSKSFHMETFTSIDPLQK